MPRKKKTNAEAEAAESAAQPDATAAKAAITEPGDDLPKPRRKALAKTAVKSVPKKRAGKAVAKKAPTAEVEPQVEAEIAAAATFGTPQGADAESTAHAADTFEDAFEANDRRETRTATAAAEGAEAAARPDAGNEPQEVPSRRLEGWADEDDELAGDWGSGSGDKGEGERPEPPPGKQERLQKILAAAGVASRRHAEQLILEGRVQVNGQLVTTLGSKADPTRDHIRVDGKLLHGAERLRYFMLNKPRGYVTTVSDPEGRPTVMEFFQRMGERVYPVGRLDYLSEGLLLMTNDGELANKLTRAASGVEKVYLVKVSGQPDENAIRALREGVGIERGRPGEGRVQTAAARIRQFRQGENPWFEVGLIEGRNRELRKMFEEIGHHVEKIRRVGYGPLELDLEPGKTRELTPEEVQTLRLAAEGKLKPKRMRTGDMLPREAGRTVDQEAGKRHGTKPYRSADSRRETSGGRQGFAGRRGAEARPESRPEWRPQRRPEGRPEQRFGQAQGRREFGAEGGQDRGGFKRTGERKQWSAPRVGGGLRAEGGQGSGGGERAGGPRAGGGQRAGEAGPRRDSGSRMDRRGGRQERGGRFSGERPAGRRPFGEGSRTGARPPRTGPADTGRGRSEPSWTAPARTGPARTGPARSGAGAGAFRKPYRPMGRAAERPEGQPPRADARGARPGPTAGPAARPAAGAPARVGGRPPSGRAPSGRPPSGRPPSGSRPGGVRPGGPGQGANRRGGSSGGQRSGSGRKPGSFNRRPPR